MKEFSCKKMGNNCDGVLSANTDERLVELVSMHLREVHGITALSQEKLGQIKGLFVNRSMPDKASVVDRIFEKYNCDKDPECTWRYIAKAESILTGKETVHGEELKAA